MTLVIPSNDAIWISRDLYCKTPQSLEAALETLRATGYTVEDMRDPANHYSPQKRDDITTEEMEQHGGSLWFAHLENIRYGKCKSCGSYIDRRGIRMHGHRCEVCGEVTYYELAEGSTVKFTFRDDNRGWLAPYLRMNVKQWDTDAGWLYLVREFGEGHGGTMNAEQAEAYLADHTDKWEGIEDGGQQLIKLRYLLTSPGDATDPEAVFELRDSWGHYKNYTDVRLWKGEEFDEYDFLGKKFPVPETISIYETWHWAPLEPSPTLHERILSAVGLVSDAGYYYQDGRQAWGRQRYEEMGIFIRHLTTLDADEWDRQSRRFRLDGPGGIADVAAFCHPNAVIENQPNIGNFIVGLTKSFSGQPLTTGEAAAMRTATAEDPATHDFITAVAEEGRRRRTT